MKIAFGEIGRGKTRYNIQDHSWLAQNAVETVSSLAAEITLQATGEDRVALEGVLKGIVSLDCARCGDPVAYELDEEFLYLVTTREEEISELQEKECSDEECNTLYLKEPVIDVAEILVEQFHLAVPAKVICGADCRGLCPECGGSLNRGECSCKEPEPDSPFAVLRKLKKD
ncbi:YceD family protein [Desulfopila aestuarii]|uniref:DUF177 domain-containing protein n=1 Tax=Desulfopila aestuarii DSM 18488 TaxID=1121416 RepID=A0A1M7YEH5_9BACT|nr:DUF177 domain-containing protein [Desulfopila aestuarii]SHO51030.1 uncharacterized protein SAMN02745220_03777 [Desulfopila aestuarii DSM 18488]